MTRSILLLVVVFLSIFQFSQAQESLTLSVSPTLFDMSAEKGQSWQSNIKVINVNKYDLTVYVSVVNFVPRGEGGEVSFIPIDQTARDNSTFAEWVTITSEPIVIPSEQTVEVPFSIKVPSDASPGGHYAAILVGTRPLQDDKRETKVQTSQMVTSLIFTRIAGDIHEIGDIREFRAVESLLNKPEATFELRFENKGNVFLQPQGEIKITNMWGEERGIIPINQNSQYGKVPQKTANNDGIRKFTFAWKGEWSISDIGRYTAVVTLGYGVDKRQFVTAETNFWVIPVKLLLGILTTLGVFIFLVSWLIKLYVRRMLSLAGLEVDEYKELKKKGERLTSRQLSRRGVKIHTPVKIGILDLKSQLANSNTLKDYFKITINFIIRNYLFFLGLVIVLIFIVAIVWYIKNANTSHRAFEVTYVNNDSSVSVSSEELIYNQLKATSTTQSDSTINKNDGVSILLINRSGVSGVGAKTRLSLEDKGYNIKDLKVELDSTQKKTVIIYNEGYEETAMKLSSELNNALISKNDNTQNETAITILLGSDLETE